MDPDIGSFLADLDTAVADWHKAIAIPDTDLRHTAIRLGWQQLADTVEAALRAGVPTRTVADRSPLLAVLVRRVVAGGG